MKIAQVLVVEGNVELMTRDYLLIDNQATVVWIHPCRPRRITLSQYCSVHTALDCQSQSLYTGGDVKVSEDSTVNIYCTDHYLNTESYSIGYHTRLARSSCQIFLASFPCGARYRFMLAR